MAVVPKFEDCVLSDLELDEKINKPLELVK